MFYGWLNPLIEFKSDARDRRLLYEETSGWHRFDTRMYWFYNQHATETDFCEWDLGDFLRRFVQAPFHLRYTHTRFACDVEGVCTRPRGYMSGYCQVKRAERQELSLVDFHSEFEALWIPSGSCSKCNKNNYSSRIVGIYVARQISI